MGKAASAVGKIRKIWRNNQGCARDLLSRDRDKTHVSETETFKILYETRCLKSETRRCSFRDAGRDLKAPETLRVSGASTSRQDVSVTYGETH